MQFPGFYGNEALKKRLSASSHRFSHCYMIEGPAGSGKKTLARLLAAAMTCQAPGSEIPCGQCPSCRKSMGSGHPDIITIDSDTATIPIRLIRNMQADAFIRPNEGNRKIYIIPRAQDMQLPAQNALLKLLEEPPQYCSFLLLTDSAEKLLETVRSRAVILSMAPLRQEVLETALSQAAPDAGKEEKIRAIAQCDGYLGAALSLLNTPETATEQQILTLLTGFASGDELALLNALVPLEKLKRQELLTLLENLKQALVRAMNPNALPTQSTKILSACSPYELFAAAEAVSYAITLLQANGTAGHAIGSLMARMRP